MKKILSILAFLPVVAFAQCPVLTGEYVCEIPLPDGVFKLPIKIVTDGNSHAFTNILEKATEVWVADNTEKPSVAHSSEGDVRTIYKVWCENNELRSSFHQEFYHDSGYVQGKVPTMEKLLLQTFYVDVTGNLQNIDTITHRILGKPDKSRPEEINPRTCRKNNE